MLLRLSTILSALLVLQLPAFADTFYVTIDDQTTTVPGGDGSAENPWWGIDAIQRAYTAVVALAPPAIGVHRIEVGPGTYQGWTMEAGPNLSKPQNDLEIIAVGGPDETFVAWFDDPNGPAAPPHVSEDYALMIANGCSRATLIKGFTFNEYHVDGTIEAIATVNVWGTHGAGSNQFEPVIGSSPTIEDCVFTNNVRLYDSILGDNYGGCVMAIATSCDPLILNCRFEVREQPERVQSRCCLGVRVANRNVSTSKCVRSVPAKSTVLWL